VGVFCWAYCMWAWCFIVKHCHYILYGLLTREHKVKVRNFRILHISCILCVHLTTGNWAMAACAVDGRMACCHNVWYLVVLSVMCRLPKETKLPDNCYCFWFFLDLGTVLEWRVSHFIQICWFVCCFFPTKLLNAFAVSLVVFMLLSGPFFYQICVLFLASVFGVSLSSVLL